MSNELDKYRNNAVSKINKIIKDEYKSRIIEKSIYNYCITYSTKNNISRNWSNILFKNLYLNKLISIYSNIDNDSYLKNLNFRELILKDKIDLEEIANMSQYDIFPERWKYLIDEKIKKDKLLSEMKPNEMTDQFRCGKCGERKCSYFAAQTRSADEPMTIFVTCLNCNNRFKK